MTPTTTKPKHICPKCGEATPRNLYSDGYTCVSCGVEAVIPDHPCPECGYGMTYEPPEHNYGADADGNRGVTLPGGWGCECGHFEKDEKGGSK